MCMISRIIVMAVGLVNLVGCGKTPTSQLTEQFPVIRSGPYNMEFGFIPKGLFLAGDDEPNTRRWVRLSKDYWVQTKEVTRGQWHAVMGTYPDQDVLGLAYGVGKCADRDKVIARDDHPVVCVTWLRVQEYIERLNGQFEGGGYEYRLPTDAEWEYAAKSHSVKSLLIDSSVNLFAWHRDNSGDQTHRGGELKANFFGLYDIYGNVHEWVLDDGLVAYEKADDPLHPVVDPLMTKARPDNKLLRGGGFNTSPSILKASYRAICVNNHPIRSVGFRMIRVETETSNR